jgi:alkylhydroperoxidase family enzyme
LVLHADQVSTEDIEALRRHSFSDEESLDIVLAVAGRSFFSSGAEAAIRPR